MRNNKSQSGIALFISVIVASVVLSLGLFMANIYIKEIILSSSARESQIAFFAADSGMECALYWDAYVGGSVFASTTDSDNSITCNRQIVAGQTGLLNPLRIQTVPPFEYESQIGCVTSNLDPDPLDPNPCAGPVYSYFTISFETKENVAPDFPDSPCAIISVLKTVALNNPGNTDDGFYYYTVIESRGYNTCNPSNPKRIERAVRVQ